MMEDIRLTPEEIRRLYKGNLTDEEVEQLRDFLALYATIVYEAAIKENNPEYQK